MRPDRKSPRAAPRGPEAPAAAARIPARIGLAAQAVEILRDRVRAGEWRDRLPPERTLCTALRIARNTLRVALAELEREGWIAPGHRGRARALLRNRPAGSGSRTRRVVFLTPERLESLHAATLVQLDLLREHLHDAGLAVHAETSAAYGAERPGVHLARLREAHPDAVWILHQATHPMQAWFADSGARAIVLGYAYPDVRLPYVSEDLAAAAVHAALRLIALGHRRIVLLRPERELAGHRVIHDALAGCLRARLGIPARRVGAVHDGTVAGACRTLDLLLDRPEPPTAVLTVTSGALVTVATHLGRRGVRIGRDLSLVHMFEEPVLQTIVPSVAHYRVNPQVLVGRLAERVVRLAASRRATLRPARVMCTFVPGESLAPSRA